MFLYISTLYSAQGTFRRGGHGGALHRDGSGGVAGLTAKSWCQAAVETGGPRKDQREQLSSLLHSVVKGVRPPKQSDCTLWTFPLGARGHLREYCQFRRASALSFLRKGVSRGDTRSRPIRGAALESSHNNGSRDYFACMRYALYAYHACRSGRECITHNSSVCVHWNETKTCMQFGCRKI